MKKIVLLFCIVSLIIAKANAQMTTRIVRDSLFIPWELVYGPDNHIWFTQKNGYICRLEPASGKIDTLYHEMNTVIQNEGGMLGMALHPDFTNQSYVFVAYEYLDVSTYKERIVKYQYSTTSNTLSSPVILLDNIIGSNIHNGCRLLIVNNYLYITVGDAATSTNAQNVSSLNGKILRISLDGSIPSDNPVAGSPIWSWGHRNAQGMVYANNKIYSSEHGYTTNDEVNIIQKGRNYGWPNVEGFCDKPAEVSFCNDSNVVEPMIAWSPTIAPCGMDYYNHPMFPSLKQSLIMCTLKDSKLYQLKLNNTFDSIVSATVISGVSFGRLRDVCISPGGKIYLSTSNSNAGGSGTRIDKIIEIYDPSFVNIENPVNDKDLSVYPNPATDNITIRIGQSLNNKTLHYSVTDNAGKRVMSGQLAPNINTIDIRNISGGSYIIDITENQKLFTSRKFIKE